MLMDFVEWSEIASFDSFETVSEMWASTELCSSSPSF